MFPADFLCLSRPVYEPMNRPSTSKPRGICRFYTTRGGCREGDKCKFLHGQDETHTPYDKSKTCNFFLAGQCRVRVNCNIKSLTRSSRVLHPRVIMLVPTFTTGTGCGRTVGADPTRQRCRVLFCVL